VLATINDRLVGIITGSGSNIKAACMRFLAKMFWMQLKLCSKQMLKLFLYPMSTEKYGSAFSHSWKKKHKLTIAQEQKNLLIH